MKGGGVLQLLENRGVVLKGHFKLSSGLHSENYLQCAKIFEDPMFSMKIIEILAEKVLETVKRSDFDTIVSPAIGGILCGYELSRQLLCKNIFAERVDNFFHLRRSFEIKNGERVLLVEDVITTGKSVLETAKLVESLGAKIAGFACIIDRTEEESSFPLPIISVMKMKLKTFSDQEIPSHLKEIPAIKPGSRK